MRFELGLTVVVGLSWPIEHDNSCAAIVDGALVFATEEERHSRHKHSPDEPPLNALLSLFEYLSGLGIKPQDVTSFAINWNPSLFPLTVQREHFIQDSYRIANIGGSVDLETLFTDSSMWLKSTELCKRFLERVYREMGASLSRDTIIYPVEHHLSHASSAYYYSGFSSTPVITVDGSGENDSTVVWSVKNGEFEKVLALPTISGSLGFLYHTLGFRLGYDTHTGPGKIMGLSAYGKKTNLLKRFQRIVQISQRKNTPYVIRDPDSKTEQTVGPTQVYSFYNDLVNNVITEPVRWNRHGKINRSAANLAWAIQRITEQALEATVKWTKRNVGGQTLASSVESPSIPKLTWLFATQDCFKTFSYSQRQAIVEDQLVRQLMFVNM